MPAQGSGDSARTGNDIYGIGWTVRMQLRLPTDRLNGKVNESVACAQVNTDVR